MGLSLEIQTHVEAYHPILHSCFLFGISAFLPNPDKDSTATAVQNKTILQGNCLLIQWNHDFSNLQENENGCKKIGGTIIMFD